MKQICATAFLVLAATFSGTNAWAAADAPAKTDDAPVATPAPEPINYALLTHTLVITSLRAGSHDPSGTENYEFKVKMYGLLNSSEERNLDLAKRKKVVVDLGSFGSTKIESLALWREDPKNKEVKELKIEGDRIRELMARSMQEFKAREDELATMLEVTMYVKHRKYFVLSDEASVAKVSYYPIPPTKFDVPLRTDQTLTIRDDKGTNVKLSVRYAQPASTPKGENAP